MRINVIILRIINLGVLFCSVKGLQLGLLSPIEVVEEYGCHDTEVRLTCGNFDTKIAILEASFAPNCTHHECLQIDVGRLIQSFSKKEPEVTKNAERKAGQKFLETLRKTHSSKEELDLDEVEDLLTKDGNGNVQKSNISLRLVLERLIIRYLRHLSPEDDLVENHSRHRRSTLNESRSSSENDSYEHVDLNEDNIRLKSIRSNCEQQKRQISSLNLIDLQSSYNSQSDYEYNIRNVLNNRCSGKNHCSFIFDIDHPFAKIWKGGVVRIKYICMEDFRINRYCGEYLTIDYEIDPNIQIDSAGTNEPIAQPRIQPRETFLHSLKILKADDRAVGNKINKSSIFEEPQKTKSNVVKQQLSIDPGEQRRVYSQDFRLLKILPNNIDNFNDVETLGNEIYFRTEEESTAENNTAETIETITLSPDNTSSTSNRNVTLSEIGTEKNLNEDSNLMENVTITIREGGHYFTLYNNISQTLKHNNIAYDRENYVLEEIKNESSIFRETTPASSGDVSVIDISSTISNSFRSKGNVEIEPIKNESLHTFKEKNNYKFKKLSEREKITSFRPPLLHGFAMTPGYPKFYIGEFECYWNIIAPEGMQIRISILDISLRHDLICKDYLQIDDIGNGKMLFKSCFDAAHPIGIISSSNWVKVTIKTTSKFAYPKRGILLHYTTDGCINPPLPENVKLIDRTRTTAFYECLPSFLFPDSRHSTRKLTCSNIHVWDKLLPNCIEQEKLFRREVFSEDKLTLTNKKPDLFLVKNKMPSQKDADMIFDIIIPSILIAGLFIINGVIFAIIMKYRQRSKTLGNRAMELAEL